MQWTESSEIVTGLILSKRLSIGSVRPECFIPPYDEIIKLTKSGKYQIEDIIEKVGFSPVQASLDAVKNVNGLGEKDWVSILEHSAMFYDAGAKLEKFGKRLQQGDEIDWAEVKSISAKALDGIGGDFVPLSNIEPGEMPFKKTGFKALDDHIGGLPLVGQVIVAAATGSGKTTFMTGLASCWVKEHPEENVAIFTLEMMSMEIARRFNETSHLDKEQKSRIHVNDAIITPEEVISKASTIENLGLVCIDFADLLIKGDTNESAMAHIYRTFMVGAKQLQCPVVLLSQLNREYNGGIPRPNKIRYTGLAEALGWMVLMLYNPSIEWFEDDKEEKLLPCRTGTAYIIVWKVRGGFRIHPDESPGAVQVQFKGNKGWRTDSSGRWFSLRKL